MLSSKTLAFLALLLALLLLGLRYADRHLAGTADASAPPLALLTADPGRIDELSISLGTFQVDLRRDRGGWLFVDGSGRADAPRIDLFLDTLAHARVRDRISPRQRQARELPLSAFGLPESSARDPATKPRAGVRATGPDGSLVFLFGSDTPSGDGVFALRSGDDAVYAVDRSMFDLLPTSTDDLRERMLFARPGREIAELEIRRRDAPTVRLARDGLGRWTLRAPYVCAVDSVAVSALLSALVETTADRFVWTPGRGASPARAEDARIAHGLSPDEAALSLSILHERESAPDAFDFAAPRPDAPSRVLLASAAGGGTVIVEVDRVVYDALRMSLDDLRDRRIAPFSPDEVLSVSLRSGDGPFSLARSDAAAPWAIEQPSRHPADAFAADAFLSRLLEVRDVRAEPWDPAAAPAPLEAVRLELRTAGSDDPVECLFVPPEGGEVAVLVPSAGIRRLVPAERVPPEVFSSSALAALRDRDVISAGSPVLSLARAVPADPAPETVRLDAGGSWVCERSDRVADPAAAEAAAALFTNLVATAAVALSPADSSAYGLLPPRVELSARVADPARPVVILQLGAALPDGSAYLRRKGDDAVFVVPPATAAALAAPLLLPADR